MSHNWSQRHYRDSYFGGLTFITVAGFAILWGCDLVVRFTAGADLCTRRGAVGCGRGVCAHGEDHSGATAVQIVWSSRRSTHPH